VDTLRTFEKCPLHRGVQYREAGFFLIAVFLQGTDAFSGYVKDVRD
jgi:hypothetical protein